ncbi:MAG: CopD family protein [Micrococcales bacterium]|nr:CopD family protein [Micrococcales bacterium]
MSAPTLRLGRLDPARFVVGLAVVGGAVTVVGVTVATSRQGPVTAGLPDAGPLTGLVGAAARMVTRLAAVVAVGGLLVPAWLVTAGDVPSRCARAVRAAAWTWVGGCVVSMLAASAQALAVPLPRAAVVPRVWAFVAGLDEGRALMATAVLAALVASGTRLARTAGDHLVLLGVALLAILPTAMTGHAATAALHVAVSAGTAVHVLAALLWVGGLVGLGLLGRAAGLVPAVSRFSGLALAAVLAVTLSGLLSAWWRLGADPAAWRSGYGALVVAKTGLLVVLAALGAVHRRHTLPALRRGSARAWWQVMAIETAVMGATLGVAVALGRTATPTRRGVVALPHGGVTTVDRYLPEPTVLRLVVEPQGSATAVVTLTVGLLLVGLAVSQSTAPRRDVLRGAGLGLASVAVLGWLLLGGPGAYGSAVLLMHGAQLVLAAALVPPLAVAAARVLAPAASPAPRAGVADAVLAFAALCLVVYGTPLLRLSLSSEAVHTTVVVAAALAGLPVARRVRGADRRLGVLLLLGVGLALLVVLARWPGSFAPDWFNDLPLDWADPVRGTGVSERAG